MLSLLEKVTLRPGELDASDIQPLRRAGLGTAAIRDALYVCFLFNVYDRIADSLHFRLHPEGEYQSMARMLLKRGYV